LPAATPTTRPISTQVNASVIVPAGATSPTSWFCEAWTGAISRPANGISRNIASGLPASSMSPVTNGSTVLSCSQARASGRSRCATAP
jgi:hypothetical protein